MEKRRKSVVITCVVLLAVIVALAIIVVSLYFTVFRPRSPKATTSVVSMRISAVDPFPQHVSFNLSFDVGVTVKNPNYAAFQYGDVVTGVTYHGKNVGDSTLLAGEIKARATETVVATVVVDVVSVVSTPQFLFEFPFGMLPFETTTAVNGKAVMLGTFKIHASSLTACSINTYVFKGESDAKCTSSVHVG